MQIRTQLIALGVTGILLVLIVGALSVYAKRKVDVALEANTLKSTRPPAWPK
jgi:flagellar biosynthesis/type III secretory pathway M-ring protein FliF/YscJ